MKRYGHLYEQIIDVENCRQAIINASKSKKRRAFVLEVVNNVDYYAQDLSNRLQTLNFTTPYKPKVINDGLNHKEREIQVPTFYPDQCAHHAIIQIIHPLILKTSYYWSCANIPKRGIDLASKGVTKATMRDSKNAKYCVKLDITKFYPSMPHDLLKESLRKKIKDEKVLPILYALIDSFQQGLPIGNYTSPWLAEFYLQPLDRYIKETLKIKYYIRYADDMVLIDSNKRKLRKAMYDVIAKVDHMGLKIKHNYQLFPIRKEHSKLGRQIDFVGRCFGRGYITIRKRRALRFMQQSRKIQKLQKANAQISHKMASGFISRSSCLCHTNSFGLRKKYYEPVDIENLKEVVRNESYRKLKSSTNTTRI